MCGVFSWRQADWELAPPTKEYEFFGPFGTALTTVGTSVIVYILAAWCHGTKWPDEAAAMQYTAWLDVLKQHLSWDVSAVLIGWWVFQAVLHVVVPGPYREGAPLRDGSRLLYKNNALACFLLTAVVAALVQYYAPLHCGVDPAEWIVENFPRIAANAILLCFVKSVWLYIRSYHGQKKMLAEGGNSGIPPYDFFMGRELNPRVYLPLFDMDFDLKYFNELRPGLVGWALVNVAFAIHQKHTVAQHHFDKEELALQGISLEMWFVLLSQLYYVLDAQIHETNILSTMDITTDGFGYMLVMGDLAWVPVVYTLPARFLADNPIFLPWYCLSGVVLLYCVGLYIFRAANNEKDTFRKEPDAPEVANLSYVPTDRGTRLLADSWWGMARHVNYLGDWIIGLSWCLATGFHSPIPYFFAVYFAILLIHRERRDEHKCAGKYGDAWVTYTQVVPYRIVPGLY